MSNAIYGFAEFIKPEENNHQDLVAKLQRECVLGVSIIKLEELYNFPDICMPTKNALVFSLSDRPGSHNATYLIDGLDYVPEADLGLPNQSIDRLEILLEFIDSLFEKHGVCRVCLAINECEQIDQVVRVNRKNYRKKLIQEFKIISPPNILIDIISDT